MKRHFLIRALPDKVFTTTTTRRRRRRRRTTTTPTTTRPASPSGAGNNTKRNKNGLNAFKKLPVAINAKITAYMPIKLLSSYR